MMEKNNVRNKIKCNKYINRETKADVNIFITIDV